MAKAVKAMILPESLRNKEHCENNVIHPTAMIHPKAKIGRDNCFGPQVFIGEFCEIGDSNKFEGFASVGTPAEHRNFFNMPGRLVIGSNNVIREFTTINYGTYGVTKMGHHCCMLRGSHLSHDSVLEDMVNISCNVLIGGESLVMEGANIGLGAILHQRSIIGSYCMIGMGSVITKKLDCSPGSTFVGNPAKFLKLNTVGLHRARISDAQLMQEIARYEKIKFKRP